MELEQLRKTIIKVIKKYDNIELEETEKDTVRVQFYMKNLYYRTLEITKDIENKWKVRIIPLNITKSIDLVEIIDLIYTFEKYSTAKEYSERDIRFIKKKYSEGTRIELIKMYDYLKPVPTGTKGTIDKVDDLGTVHMKWDNGSNMPLIVGVDEFEIIER